jgi:hypothetical protein
MDSRKPGRASLLERAYRRFIEDIVHHRAATDRGDDYVPVDGLGDVGGLVAHRVADPGSGRRCYS